MKLSLALAVSISASALLSCGRINPFSRSQRVVKEFIPIPDVTDYKHILDSNDQVKQAAKAVVLIETLNGISGTGFFIHQDGILMTNHHVLGSESCLIDGCFIEIRVGYEKGTEQTESVSLFAEPLRINEYYDYSIWRVRTVGLFGMVKEPYKAAASVKFVPKTTTELLGTSVTLIGHPEGKLKKAKHTTVIESSERYAVTDKPVLGGTSGSPYINAEGFVVGINHSSNNVDESSISASGIQGLTFFSTSETILKTAGLTEDTDLSKLSPDDSVKILPKFEPYNPDAEFDANTLWRFKVTQKVSTSVDSPLRKKFESDLQAYYETACKDSMSKDLDGMEVFEMYQKNCTEILNWLSCSCSTPKLIGLRPSDTEVNTWSDLAYQFATKLYDLESRFATVPLFFALRLGLYKSNSNKLFSTYVKRFINEKNPELNFALALAISLAASSESDLEYQGQSLVSFVTNFEKQPMYHHHIGSIAENLLVFWNLEILSESEIKNHMLRLFNDPRCSLSDRLLIEEMLYNSQLLAN